jgi:hypothetical protein
VRAGGSERLRLAEAMRFEDVSFMLRTGTSEAEILHEIVQRGLVDPITPAQAKGLSGASPAFIQGIQDPRYVLTPTEREQYLRRRQVAPVQSNGTQQLHLAGTTEPQREEARKEYAQRRAFLEGAIQDAQERINQYRRDGTKESNLAAQERQLHALRDQLSSLKAP